MDKLTVKYVGKNKQAGAPKALQLVVKEPVATESRTLNQDRDTFDAGVRERYAAKQISAGERVGAAATGAARTWMSGFVNTLGTAQEVTGGELREKYLAKDQEQLLKELERYQYNADNALTQEEKAVWEAEVQKAQNTLRMRGESLAETKTAGDKTQALADRLQEAGTADIARAKDGLGAAGRFAVDAGVGLVQLGADALAGGLPATFLRGAGSAAQEARQSGADLKDQVLYGAGSGLVSVATEKISNVAGPFKKIFGAGMLDDAITKATGKLGQSAVGKLALSAIGEGGEEFLEAMVQPVLQRATYNQDASFDLSEALYSAAIGATLGGLGGAVDVVGSAAGKVKSNDIMPKLSADRQTEWSQMLQGVPQEKQNAFAAAEQIAKNFGATLDLADLGGAAGSYQDGRITIDPKSTDPVRQVLVHELTHHMETSGLYSQFSGRVMHFIAEDMGVDVESLMQSITEEYGQQGVTLDGDAVSRELVAKFAENKLFQDEKSIQRLLQADRNLFQKIYDWIRDAVAKVRGTSEEKFLIDAQRLYEKALRSAVTTESSAEQQFTFGGKNAKTADLEALERARTLEQQGIDAEAIRTGTGWYRGMDGKWRFEIDDSQMRYYANEGSSFENERINLHNKLQGGNATLQDVIQHDELFEAYPELRDVKVRYENLELGRNAYYDPMSNTVVLSTFIWGHPEVTLLHEVQHAIQNREGFAKGSNPDYWAQAGVSIGRNDKAIQRADSEYRRLFDSAPKEAKRLIRSINQARLREDWDTVLALEEEIYASPYADIYTQLGDVDFERRSLRESNKQMSPRELYENTAGEIESRDVADRIHWTQEQRELQMPRLGDDRTVFAEDMTGYMLSEDETLSIKQQLIDNQDRLNTMKAVATINDNGWRGMKTGDFRKKIISDLKQTGFRVEHPDVGVIEFTEKDLNQSLNYMRTDAEAAAYQAIPKVLKRGIEISGHANHKNRGYSTLTIAAPVELNGKRGHMAVVVKQTKGNRYKVHRILTPEGNDFKLPGMANAESTSGGGITQSANLRGVVASPINSASEDSISRGRQIVNEDIMPRLTDHNGKQFSMGRSFDELVQNQRDGTVLGRGGQFHMQGFETEAARDEKMNVVEESTEESRARQGDAGTDGYMEALARDENEMTDPVTPADIVYDAKLRGLQQEEAPPESSRQEPVAKRDLDELVDLYQDIANPVDTARSARFEASEGLVSAGTSKEKTSLRQRGSEAKSYFMRKMVDAGDSVTRLGKTMKDSYLYPFYNMARASASAGISMIQNEQTDITGKRVGESLNDIFTPIREKGDDYYIQFQTYLFDLHNIDRMRLVSGDNTAKLEAEMALREFDRENPDVATLTEARLQRKAESIDEEEAALAKERIRLLRKLNQADRMGNKPVFGWEVTADMSQERSDRLLREHPEFAQYREQVRGYVKNLMQYRVDSGLMTAEDAAFLERYYPNYVPTFRKTEKTPTTKDRKNVNVGKTVGLAEGGDQKLVPLHEALGKQTMQVVREGSKNRFGARLLDDFNNHSHEESVRKYILDAKEYESDFSTETFDEPEVELKKENTFTVYRNGKKYEMTVDPSMFDAVKALYPDAQESNVAIKAIRAGNNLFKSLVTGYNPTFTVRNTVRDLQTAGMYSRDAGAFAKNYPLALQEIAKDGEFWKQYKALGGSFSSVFDYQTGTVKEPDGKVAKFAARMEALNMAMEQAPRLAEFMSVVKAGDGSLENLMDAMHAAADVTVNFGRAGTLGKVLNANFVPFLNPGIQGFDKMVRRVTETRGTKEWAKLAVRAAALGVLPSVVNAMLYSDDEDWDDLRDSDKDTNYMFKIGDGIWLKIPKGRELSILGMTVDRVQDLAKGEKVDWGDFITTVGNQVAPANPLEQNILKAWFDTDLFDASNPGRTWYGGEIESQRLQSYAPGERYDSSTDVFSKWVGQQLNLSPAKINYLLDQYSGVLGDFLLPILTPQAERDMFTKAFTVDSVSSNEISGNFYDKSDELTYAKNSGDRTAKVLSRFWSKQQSACSDLYSQIRDIESSDLSDAEKKKQVRETRAVLNGIQKNALALLDTYQAAVEKHLAGSTDEALDRAYREANRECFGAEYALEVYNKDTYEKAQQANQNGVSFEDFYTYYFDTKNFVTSGGKSANTKRMEYLQKSDLDEATKAELYFADLASDSDLKKQAELENSNAISAVAYWQYKVATAGMSKKAEKLEAINSLNLTPNQKTALYYANGWAESTLDEAPWYVPGEISVKSSAKTGSEKLVAKWRGDEKLTVKWQGNADIMPKL